MTRLNIWIYALFVFSCGIPGPLLCLNLYDSMKNNPDLSQFINYVDSASQSMSHPTLKQELNNSEVTTVFAPNNAAMEKMASLSPAAKNAILSEHIFTASDMTTPNYNAIKGSSDQLDKFLLKTAADNIGYGPTMVSTYPVFYWVKTNQNENFVNQARILSADQSADNGVYHVVSLPIYSVPPSPNPPTLQEFFTSPPEGQLPIAKSGSYWSQTMTGSGLSFLKAYYTSNGLSNRVFTLFIPVDSAWNLPSNVLNSLSNWTLLDQVLRAHLAQNQIFFPEWLGQSSDPNAVVQMTMQNNGAKATIRYINNDYYIQSGSSSAKILASRNILVKQGVVHFIDSVLGVQTQDTSTVVQRFAPQFYTACQGDATCKSFLMSNNNTVLAVSDNGMKSWPQMTADSSVSFDQAMEFYFLAGIDKVFTAETVIFTTVRGRGEVRYRRSRGVGYLEARLPNGRGYMSARIERHDVGGNGPESEVIIISDVLCCKPPAGSTIQQFLIQTAGANSSTSVPLFTVQPPLLGNNRTNSTNSTNDVQYFGSGPYSQFLSDWSSLGSFFDLKKEPGYMTLFAPTNQAMDRYRSAGIQYSDFNKRKKILQRHLIPNELVLFNMRTLPISYDVATANYRDMSEFIQLRIQDNNTATIRIRQKEIRVNLREGGIYTSNGYVYSVDDVLYDNTD